MTIACFYAPFLQYHEQSTSFENVYQTCHMLPTNLTSSRGPPFRHFSQHGRAWPMSELRQHAQHLLLRPPLFPWFIPRITISRGSSKRAESVEHHGMPLFLRLSHTFTCSFCCQTSQGSTRRAWKKIELTRGYFGHRCYSARRVGKREILSLPSYSNYSFCSSYIYQRSYNSALFVVCRVIFVLYCTND